MVVALAILVADRLNFKASCHGPWFVIIFEEARIFVIWGYFRYGIGGQA